MSLPRLAIRRPVATSMLCLAVVLFGAVSLLHMPVALLPDLAFPKLVVYTTAAQLGPSEIERFVTEPIEEALSGLPGVRRIQSVSRKGQSLVTLTFPWGTDMDFAQLHIRERLDDEAGRVQERADRPMVLRIDPGAEPILVASASPSPRGGVSLAEVQSLAANVIRRRLEQLSGVARVAIAGSDTREVRVDLDPPRLESLGLTVDDITVALARAGASAPGGTIRRGRQRYALRLLGDFVSVDEIARTVIGTTPGGGTIRLSDVAHVRDTIAQRESAAYFDGRPSVGLLVYKESDANTVAATREVQRAFAELQKQHPAVRLDIVTSQARFVTEAMKSVLVALGLGGMLTFLVLFPFLRDWRAPVAIALAIPISVVGAFTALHLCGVSLNIVSLGGMALGIGMLVDNSIVVLENIYRHGERGLDRAEAAAVGTEEVGGAISASTLTTVAVFGPIAYVEGLIGELLGDLALAVTFSLLASLLVAQTLLPTIAARLGEPPRRRASRVSPLAIGLRSFERGFARATTAYERALDWALRRRRVVLGAATGVLASALAVGLFLPRNVLPAVDQRVFTARLELPPGSPFDETERIALAIDRRLRDHPTVDAVLMRVGQAAVAARIDQELGGATSAVLDVRLATNGATSAETMRWLREGQLASRTGTLDLESGMATQLGRVLGTDEPDVSVELHGGSSEGIRAAAAEVARGMTRIRGLRDVASSFDVGSPEIRIALDRAAITRHGLDVERVVRELNDRTRGRRAAELADFDARVPVIVRIDEGDEPTLERALSGTLDGVPLRALVRVEEGRGPASIRREGQRRVVAVTADVEGGLSIAVGAIGEMLRDWQPPPGIEVAMGGGSRELERAFRSLGVALLLALLLVYLILAAQFESLVQPLIVLFSVPLAVAGAVLTLAVTGRGLDTMSGIGIIVLVGIAVNDAIIKVDFMNQARRGGRTLRSAVAEAGRARLRPIVMTSVTTILGLLPMALGRGSGSELRAPLALAVIGGMTASTLLTLLVVPVIYTLVEERRRSL